MPFNTSVPSPNGLHSSEESHVRFGASLLRGNQEVAQEQFGHAFSVVEFVTKIKLFSGTTAQETEGGSFRAVWQPRGSFATRLRDGLL